MGLGGLTAEPDSDLDAEFGVLDWSAEADWLHGCNWVGTTRVWALMLMLPHLEGTMWATSLGDLIKGSGVAVELERWCATVVSDSVEESGAFPERHVSSLGVCTLTDLGIENTDRAGVVSWCTAEHI